MTPLTCIDPVTLLVRTTVLSTALQALVAKLTVEGLLDKGDLVAMQEVGLQLAADLADRPGLNEVGKLLADEVEAWWADVASTSGG